MSGSRPTFGDFLAAGHRSTLAAAAQWRTVTPGRDLDEMARVVAHVSRVLGRYTADLIRNIDQLPDEQLAKIGPWDCAALLSHDALKASAQALAERTGADVHVEVGSPSARSLHAAATSLTAGRDLLQGHFSTDPSGARLHQSSWALVITSPTVSRALLAEVASLALQAAVVCPADAPLTGGPRLDGVSGRLNAARYWLSQPEAFVCEAEELERRGRSGREVLHAIPANVLPKRVAEARDVAGLLNAVITTSERVRRAAWAAARVDPYSTAISVTSWHRVAAANTVTSHNCHLLFAALADRAPQHGAGDLSGALMRAAAAANNAREHWLDSAREFQEITTEIRGYVSPAAVEAAQLALWTGKLAYADPDWGLSTGPSTPVRAATNLAPEVEDMPRVVGALHEAAEAVSCLAVANLEQARLAVQAHRVLVSTRLLPEGRDIALRFTEAPESYTASLVACCQDTSHAAAAAAEAGAETAARVGTPSRILVATKAAALDQPGRDWPSLVASAAIGQVPVLSETAGPVETRLRSIGVTNARILWRANAVDRAGEQVVGDATAALARRPAQAASTGDRLRGCISAVPTQQAHAGPGKTVQPAARQLEAEP